MHSSPDFPLIPPSASCSASPLIPFSSRSKHPRYIIIISLTVVLLSERGTNDREQVSGHRRWGKCLGAGALMTREQLLVRKHLNSNTFVLFFFVSWPCDSLRCLLLRALPRVTICRSSRSSLSLHAAFRQICARRTHHCAKRLRWGNPASNVEFLNCAEDLWMNTNIDSFMIGKYLFLLQL